MVATSLLVQSALGSRVLRRTKLLSLEDTLARMHPSAGKMAAVRKKEAAARAAALQHRQRALKKLGLIPPRGSPYSEEPCLDVARTWFSQVRRLLRQG